MLRLTVAAGSPPVRGCSPLRHFSAVGLFVNAAAGFLSGHSRWFLHRSQLLTPSSCFCRGPLRHVAVVGLLSGRSCRLLCQVAAAGLSVIGAGHFIQLLISSVCAFGPVVRLRLLVPSPDRSYWSLRRFAVPDFFVRFLLPVSPSVRSCRSLGHGCWFFGWSTSTSIPP